MIAMFINELCQDGFNTDSIRSAVDAAVSQQLAIHP